MLLKRLSLSGKDCVAFLHRQLTADIESLQTGQQQIAAWCNIQGRVLSLLWLNKHEDSIELLIPNSSYSNVMPRLQMFVLRDDVAFSEPQDGVAYWDQKQSRLLLSDNDTNWKTGFIENGIPYLESDACAEYLPQMLNLDHIDGLSFKKGCYPGQEIVARTHFKGRLKQRMMRLQCASQEGAELYDATGKKIGAVILAQGEQCLAMVRLEESTQGIFDHRGEAAARLPLPYES